MYSQMLIIKLPLNSKGVPWWHLCYAQVGFYPRSLFIQKMKLPLVRGQIRAAVFATPTVADIFH